MVPLHMEVLDKPVVNLCIWNWGAEVAAVEVGNLCILLFMASVCVCVCRCARCPTACCPTWCPTHCGCWSRPTLQVSATPPCFSPFLFPSGWCCSSSTTKTACAGSSTWSVLNLQPIWTEGTSCISIIDSCCSISRGHKSLLIPVDQHSGDPQPRERSVRHERWPGVLQPTDSQTYLHGPAQVLQGMDAYINTY